MDSGMPETRRRSDARRLTAAALMTPVYAGAGENKHGNTERGSEYSGESSAALTGRSEPGEVFGFATMPELFLEVAMRREARLALARR